MTIAEIISEIDAYLISLRHARELLLVPKISAQRKMPSGSKKKVQARKPPTALSSRVHIPEKQTPSSSPALQGKAKERVDLVSQVPGPVARPPAHPERPPTAPAKVAPPRTLEIKAISANEQKPPAKSQHPRTTRRAFVARPEKIKPATALTGSMSSRVVVVSAEEVKRERDRLAVSVVRPKRGPTAGLTGRRAFEALFNDVPDSSKTS